jgi:hypothetical protein
MGAPAASLEKNSGGKPSGDDADGGSHPGARESQMKMVEVRRLADAT